MSVMELLASRRTYRRFEQKAVPQDVVEDIIEALRLSSCGANRQAVRLVVVNRPEDVARVQPLVKWAAYLPPEQGTPKADELPTLYVAVVQDTSIPGDLATDTGIALANMTLAAWAKGVGSCIMGAINKPALTRLLGIEEPQKLAFMVAFGYPAHKAGIVPETASSRLLPLHFVRQPPQRGRRHGIRPDRRSFCIYAVFLSSQCIIVINSVSNRQIFCTSIDFSICTIYTKSVHRLFDESHRSGGPETIQYI